MLLRNWEFLNELVVPLPLGWDVFVDGFTLSFHHLLHLFGFADIVLQCQVFVYEGPHVILLMEDGEPFDQFEVAVLDRVRHRVTNVSATLIDQLLENGVERYTIVNC